MKRTPLIFGLSFLAGLSSYLLFKNIILLYICAVAALASIILMFFKNFRKCAVYSLVLLSFSLAAAVSHITYVNTARKAEEFFGKELEISGVISEFPSMIYGKNYYILSSATVNGSPVNGKIKLSSAEYIMASMDDSISGTAYLYKPSNYSYSMSENIFLAASLSSPESVTLKEADSHSFFYYPSFIKEKIKEALKYNSDGDAGALMCALLTGDKSDLSQKVKFAFSNTGISHMLAVSGLHLTILVSFIKVLLSKFKCHRFISSGISIFIIVLFCAITGFRSSVVRSGVMCVIMIAAGLFKRKADSLNSLGIAVSLICILNPFSPLDIGFLLSAAATGGIIILNPLFEKQIRRFIHTENLKSFKKPVDYFISVFSCSVSASAFILPFSVFYFGRLSLLSPLVNVLLMFPFTVLLVLAIIIAALFYIPYLGAVASILSYPANFLANLFLDTVKFLSGIPFMSIESSSVYIKVWLSLMLICAAAAVLIERRKLIRIFCAAGTAMLCTAFILQSVSSIDEVKIIVNNAGSNTSVFVTDGKDTSVIGI